MSHLANQSADIPEIDFGKISRVWGRGFKSRIDAGHAGSHIDYSRPAGPLAWLGAILAKMMHNSAGVLFSGEVIA